MDPVPVASHVISADSIEGKSPARRGLAARWRQLSYRSALTVGGAGPTLVLDSGNLLVTLLQSWATAMVPGILEPSVCVAKGHPCQITQGSYGQHPSAPLPLHANGAVAVGSPLSRCVQNTCSFSSAGTEWQPAWRPQALAPWRVRGVAGSQAAWPAVEEAPVATIRSPGCIWGHWRLEGHKLESAQYRLCFCPLQFF